MEKNNLLSEKFYYNYGQCYLGLKNLEKGKYINIYITIVIILNTL